MVALAARRRSRPARSASRRRSARRHTDGDGAPGAVAAARRATSSSRWPARVRDHPGTTLEFIPAVGEIAAERIELMADMSLAAEPAAQLEPARQPVADRDLRAAARGVRPRGAKGAARRRAHAARPDAHAGEHGARDAAGLGVRSWRCDDAGRRAAVADPEHAGRGCATASAEAAERRSASLADFDLIGDRRRPARPGSAAASPRSRAERGADPVDVLIDVVLPDRLPLTMVFPSLVPSLGRVRRGLGGAGRGLAATRGSCSAAPTPARTSTSCATPTTRPWCSARRCATAACSRSRRRCTS